MFDTLFAGGWVVDGQGGPPFRADLGVEGGRITAIGRLEARHAHSVVDVTDRFLLPGFVDTHTHVDGIANSPEVELAALRQGVTTVLLGQDGLSFAPGSASTIAAVSRYFSAVNGDCPIPLRDGCSVADLLAHYDRNSALNVAYLAPAGTLRVEVNGFSDSPLNAGQLRAMRTLVETALADGAVGLSSGLEYTPGQYADAAELGALCTPVAEAGGIYVTHMRGYETNAWRGMAEVAEVIDLSGVATHISHLHGPANMLVSLVDENRAAGRDLTFDAYPYLRGSTILAMVALPAELQRGGPDATLARLADPAVRARLSAEWFPSIADTLQRVTLAHVAAAAWAWTEGLPLPQAAAQAGLTPGDLVCELILASDLGVGCVFAQPPTNTDADLRTLLRHEAHMAGSDGILLGGHPHPRGWGTFARLLGRHTRELGDWTWGEAAVHLAGHPARRFGLVDRGVLRVGAAADLVVLDPLTITDRADYANPTHTATGVDHVMINGQFALRDGEPTGRRTGRALRHGKAPQ